MTKGLRRLTCKGLQALTYKKAKRGKAEEEYRTVPWVGKKKCKGIQLKFLQYVEVHAEGRNKLFQLILNPGTAQHSLKAEKQQANRKKSS